MPTTMGKDQQIGVGIGVIREILAAASERGLATTTEVCNGYIKPLTEERKCAYVDILRDTRPGQVAKATVFISHAWKYDFADSVDVMEQYEATHPGTFFWFDLIVNNQHGTEERPFEWWCNTFRSNIVDIGSVVLVLAPWDKPIPLTRSWCLFEIMSTFLAMLDPRTWTSMKFEMLMPAAQERKFIEELKKGGAKVALSALLGTKMEESQAFLESDRENIFRAVEASIGFALVNSTINDQIRKWYLAQGEKVATDMLSTTPEERLLADADNSLVFIRSYADLLLEFEQWERAQKYWELVLKIQTTKLGASHLENAATHNALGQIAMRTRRPPKESLPHFETAIAIVKREQKGLDVALAPFYSNIAVVHLESGHPDKALKFFKLSLKLYEDSDLDEPMFQTTSFNNIGNVLLSKKNFPEALVHYEKALAIARKAFGNESLTTAQTLSNIALIHQHTGDVDKELGCLDEALTVYLKVHGKKHPWTVDLSKRINALQRMRETEQRKRQKQASQNATSSSKEEGPQHPLRESESTDQSTEHVAENRLEDAINDTAASRTDNSTAGARKQTPRKPGKSRLCQIQ